MSCVFHRICTIYTQYFDPLSYNNMEKLGTITTVVTQVPTFPIL